jgi:tripartite-type tricarboxylate transporter receptor subunit TctC
VEAIRALAWLVALALAGPAAAQTQAQTYPAKPVRMIVPFAPAGPTDVIARLIAQKLSETWGHQVYVENIPGAGGNTGTATAARAPGDGYTMLVVSTGFIINPSLYAKVPYAISDFAPISLIAASPNAVSVHPSFPAKSIQELIALVKASPGKYSYAQPATGSTPHLAGELFKLRYGLDLTMVPFTSAGLAMNSTIGGHTPIAFTALPPAMTNIQAGKLRGLAVMAAKRNVGLPDVPTMAEAGIPDQESDTLTGIVAHAGTPKEIVDRWHAEIVRIVALPDIKERLDKLGFDTVASSPAEFTARIKSEAIKWDKVAKDANIRMN